MKYIIYSIFITVLLLSLPLPIAAQDIFYNKQIKVTIPQLQQKGDFLDVHMELDLSQLDIDYNRSLTLTPILISSDNQIELPEIVVNGTNRHRAYMRSITLKKDQSFKKNVYKEIKSDKKNTSIHYQMTIPYQEWMSTARLDVRENLCGCGGYQEEISVETWIDKVDLEKIVIPQPPIIIESRKEIIVSKMEQWEAELDFPVNETVIYSTYMNNSNELSKAESKINKLKADTSITITRVDIIGFASPEGSITGNQKLSIGRAEALKEYLSQKIDLPSNMYYVLYGGENWDRLKTMLEASEINQKDEIISIIDNTSDATERKNKLKALDGGTPYQQILKTIYPKLRKVMCNVYYNMRTTTIEEEKIVSENNMENITPNKFSK